jgi:manganese/zinc/iron transport system substrate-binding protein
MNFCIKLFFAFLILLSSCTQASSKRGKSREWMEENGRLKILCTTAQIGDLVKAVGGDKVDCWVLIPSQLDPHSYEPVKGDGEKIGRAQLVFYNGLGLEHGASLAALLAEKKHCIPLGDRIGEKHANLILSKEGVMDPHIWMDISLWKKGIQEIVDCLASLDAQNQNYYLSQGSIVEKELDQTHLELQNLLHEIVPEKRFLITSHDAFRYFSRAYLGEFSELHPENRCIAPEGLAPDGQLNPLAIQRTLDFLSARQVNALFPEWNLNQDCLLKIAKIGKNNGIDVRVCSQSLYGDSMGDFTYLEMMRHNASIIYETLKD